MAEKADYELTEAEATLLRAATEDAAAGAGALGGSIGADIAAPGLGSAKAGAAGARFGIRFLTKAQTFATRVEVPHDPETARQRARATMAASGVVIEDPNATGDGSVWGFVDTGAWTWPALVRIQVEAAGPGGSRVYVRATAREGLIKKVGAKVADRIATAIQRV